MEDNTQARPSNMPKRWRKGDPVSASKLNGLVDAVARFTNGAQFPAQLLRGPGIPQSTSYPTAARVLLTDSTQALAGLATIDSVTLNDGDLVLVSFGTTADGVYIANAGGWGIAALINVQEPPNTIPVFPSGSGVMIWDGGSAPALYVMKTTTAGSI